MEHDEFESPGEETQPSAEVTPEEPVTGQEASAPESHPPETDAPPEATTNRGFGRVEIGFIAGDGSVLGGSNEVFITTQGRREPEGGHTGDDGVLRFAQLPDGSELWVPHGTTVGIRHVDGDLRAGQLDGLVEVQRVDGDMTLHHVTAANLGTIRGDLYATGGEALAIDEVDGDARAEGFRGQVVFGGVRGDLDAGDIGKLEVHEGVGGDATITACGGVLIVGAVGGDLDLERCTGQVRIAAIGGDVDLRGIAGSAIETIGGDLEINTARGAIQISTIGGDAEVRDVSGPIHLGVVGGDLDITNAIGGLNVGQVSGDASLDTVLGAEAAYNIQAMGDIQLRTRGEVNARFVAQTFGGEISTRLPLTVERGRRRHLVGVIGRGDAVVTLRSNGGDINITASDRMERDFMSDEYKNQATEDKEATTDEARSWEGNFGGHRFRVRWDRGPDRAGVYFQGPYSEEGDQKANPGEHDFGFEWERGHGPHTYGEYEARLNDLRDRAEQMARRAAEQAQVYAEKAAKRARETDWEAVGREVRGAIEKAMVDLEDAFGQVRREWETRRPSGEPGTNRPTSQRVRIEQDDEGEPFPSNAAPSGAGDASAFAGRSQDEREAQRRTILEQLRTGSISLDEAERRLNDLR
jgi:DUF4097 and DUF4098 domain-containing protein YvlB